MIKKNTGMAMSIAAMNDRYVSKLREQAEDLELETIPHWDIGDIRGGGFFCPTLTEEHKLALLKNNKIWPRKILQLSLKSRFLDEVDLAIWRIGHSKEYLKEISDRSPKEQREKLIETAEKLRDTKKHIANLNGGAFSHACMAYQVAYMASNPEVKLRLKNDLGRDINSLLARTWVHLDDLEKILQAGAERITVSKQNKPSLMLNGGLLASIALIWKSFFGEFPPHSKEGCFYSFMQEIGQITNENFTAHTIEKIVKELKSNSEPTA